MPSLEEQLRVEERKLVRLAKWRPRGSVAAIQAKTAELTATGETVRRLRAQLGPQEMASARMEALAARRQYEAELRAKRDERKARDPARKAARKLLAFAHRELAGANLNVERLSVEEGVELLALVEERREGELSSRKLKRYQRLVGKLAGDEALFEHKAREREMAERQAAEAEQARLAAMPTRTYSGKGGVYLPPELLSGLLKPRDDGLNVTDLGVLAALLFALERGEAIFHRSEVVDGAIVLDPGTGYQLRTLLNPDSELGAGRVWESVRYLADNGWLRLDQSGGRTSIMAGERALKLREQAETSTGVT